MSKEPILRKLTAILYADVAGYSRMTGDDELGTHHAVMHALDFTAESIKTHGGTVLRWAGDAVLAEAGAGAVEKAPRHQLVVAADDQRDPALGGSARGPLELGHGPWVSRCPSLSRFTSR